MRSSLPDRTLLGGWCVLGGCLALLTFASGCSAGPELSPTPTFTPVPDPDRDAPLLVLEPIADGQAPGQPVPVFASASDASGLTSVALLYRAVGSDYWGRSYMEEASAGRYSAEVPATFIRDADIEYYVEAVDASANRNVARAPAGAPGTPARFSVQVPRVAFPVLEDFEPPAELPPESWDSFSLADRGWSQRIEGFNDGENWHLTQAHVRSGAFAAFHGHGNPFQTSDFDDYLVSPSFDVQNAASIDLYWFELADLGQYAQHALYVYSGTDTPDIQDFVPVDEALLSPPELETGYARSRHVDLSAYAGAEAITLAFRYQGLWGDDWYLDDVTLDIARSDLVLAPLETSPEAIVPGGSVQLELQFENQGLVASGPLTIRLDSPDAQLELSPSSLTLEGLAAGAQGVTPPFQVQVSADHPSDVYIPVTATVEEEERSWQVSGRIQVGRPPVAHVRIAHAFADDLHVYVGCGDPSAPVFERLVQADSGGDASGTFSWDVDVSAAAGCLPPDTDAQRWFLRTWDDSLENTGQVERFAIEWGTLVEESRGLPQPIPDDGTALLVYLPGMARPGLWAAGTVPEVLAPGDSVQLSVVLENRGAPPNGTLMGRFSSLSEHVLGLSTAPVVFSYLPIEDYLATLPATPTPTPSPSQEASPTPTSPTPVPEDPYAGVFGVWVQQQPVTFRVSPEHTDSRPLVFGLELTDDADAWSLGFSLPVPYPVLGGLSLLVEDTQNGVAGNDALSPSESAWLRIRVRNAGELPTTEAVEVSLRAASAGSARLTLPEGPYLLFSDQGEGILGPGEGGKSDPIPVTVAGGSPNEAITFELVVSGGSVSLEQTLTLALEQVPWSPLTVVDDSVGDAQSSPLDLVEGLFRRQGSVLTMRWKVQNPVQLGDSFLYAFLSGTGRWQYAIYLQDGPLFMNWVSTGEGDLGYWYRRYTPPPSLKGGQLDPYTFEVSLDLNDVGLGAFPLWGGAMVDTCGGALGCDYAPDDASSSAGQTRFYW